MQRVTYLEQSVFTFLKELGKPKKNEKPITFLDHHDFRCTSLFD